jgi:hypothetical protein
MEHHIEGTEFFSKKEAKAKFRQHIFDFWGNKCAYCRESLGRSGTIGSCSPEVQRWRNSAVQSGGLLLRLQYVEGQSSLIGKNGFVYKHFWEPHLEDAIKLWLSQ